MIKSIKFFFVFIFYLLICIPFIIYKHKGIKSIVHRVRYFSKNCAKWCSDYSQCTFSYFSQLFYEVDLTTFLPGFQNVHSICFCLTICLSTTFLLYVLYFGHSFNQVYKKTSGTKSSKFRLSRNCLNDFMHQSFLWFVFL